MSKDNRVILKRYDGNGNGLMIIYGFVTTQFGGTFIAGVSGENDAVCLIQFAQKNVQAGKEHLKKRWPLATLRQNNDLALKWSHLIFNPTNSKAINVLVKGTDFQVEVWKALLEIPVGKTCTYSQVADMIGKPRAIRAAANAVATNEIAFLIPCHRVISKDGNMFKYGWGSEVKKKIMEYEEIKLK